MSVSSRFDCVETVLFATGRKIVGRMNRSVSDGWSTRCEWSLLIYILPGWWLVGVLIAGFVLSPRYACSKAVANAIGELLNEPEIRNFLEAPQ